MPRHAATWQSDAFFSQTGAAPRNSLYRHARRHTTLHTCTLFTRAGLHHTHASCRTLPSLAASPHARHPPQSRCARAGSFPNESPLTCGTIVASVLIPVVLTILVAAACILTKLV